MVDRLAGELATTRPPGAARPRARGCSDRTSTRCTRATSCGTWMPFALGLELQDRDARLEVRRLHVHAQAPAEPADQAVLDAGQLLRRPVAAITICWPAAVQVVERVEELRLGLLALGQELDVVHQQDVDLAVPLPEPIALPFPDRLDELGHELSDVTYRTRMPGVEPVHVVADRDQQVGLAQPHAAVDEQRVVGLATAAPRRRPSPRRARTCCAARGRTCRTCSWGTAARARRGPASAARPATVFRS